MLRVLWVLLSLGGICCFPSSCLSRTWRVFQDGSGDASTIQAAINLAINGDTVVVGPGTYVENLQIVGKDMVLKSEQGVTTTTIDGSGSTETTIYLSGQTRATIVQGFTITGGTGHLGGSTFRGGGVYFDNATSAIMQDNYFFRNGTNPTTTYGGAVHINGSLGQPILRDNLFEGNQAKFGGAITLGTGDILDNTFVQNTCQYDGGAIYSVSNSGVTSIEGNRFVENFAGDHGGAAYVSGKVEAEGRVTRNLFIRNQAEGSAHDYLAGGSLFVAKVHGSVSNNTLVGTIGPTWYACSGGALSLRDVPSSLDVSANIFAFNHCAGITCRYGPQNATLGPNLFWMNDCANFGYSPAACPPAYSNGQIYADPLFCAPQLDNYMLSSDSPALTGPILMGYSTTPGCGQTGVSVLRTTWGSLKARFIH